MSKGAFCHITGVYWARQAWGLTYLICGWSGYYTIHRPGHSPLVSSPLFLCCSNWYLQDVIWFKQIYPNWGIQPFCGVSHLLQIKRTSSHVDFWFRIFFFFFFHGCCWYVCWASLNNLWKFCLEWAVQWEAPQNVAPFSILREPQLHSHWPSYSHCSCCTVKRSDKQTNKSSAHCGSLKRQSHKVSDGQNRKEWIIAQPKIIFLRKPWRKKA